MLFEQQQYQTDCVANIIQVLEACDVRNNNFENLPRGLDTLWRAQNYTQFVQKAAKRLDILMETGTGKTFTYLKTIFEIYKQFDQRKFIIVVPRTAIKLGVIQNIKLTRDYFFQEYKQQLKFIDYPKDGLSKITHDFLKTSDLIVLITTNSAFNSDKNKINQSAENLFEHGSVWQGIKEQQPFIIIDEPHLLKGTETQKGLAKLDNCLQIRFGATFPTDPKDQAHHLSNVVYSLDSISAFRKNLVKGITVHTLISEAERGNLKLVFTESTKRAFVVVYDINGVVYRKRIRRGENIGVKTALKSYQNVRAVKITKDKVFLNNRQILEVRKSGYTLGDEEIRALLKTTIDKHFEKEARLFNQNIKTLSLFFISNIADFRGADPKIKNIFEELYRAKRKEVLRNTKNQAYQNYLQKDIDEAGNLKVHEGYFSGDKGTNDKKEADGVNLILNEKENLLSFKTSLRFIFSVWALQEGWDNPNIFTICKLADTQKDTSRRQQVGRGLRIAVNQQGHRLTYKKLGEKETAFYDINTLDMVVSGKEKEFIQNIQQEIQAASYSLVGDVITSEVLKDKGLEDIEAALIIAALSTNKIIDNAGKIRSSAHDFLKNNRAKICIPDLTDERYAEILKIFTDNRNLIKDGNKALKKVKIKPKQWQSFKALWETINKKSKIVYQNIREEQIINRVAHEFKREDIQPLRIKTVSQKYDAKADKIVPLEETGEGVVNFFKTQKFADFMNFFVKKEKLPFAFMVKLLNKIDLQKLKNNPRKARHRLLTLLQDTLHGTILSNVSYKFLDTTIYPNELQNEYGAPKAQIPHTHLGKGFIAAADQSQLLYDTICFDSTLEREIQENDPPQVNQASITVFAKLPKIAIPTPYKTYNPDFAYLIEKQNGKKLFLVVEAKGYQNENDIPPQERQKINYARKFFAALQDQFEHDNLEIVYKTRLNWQGLSALIDRV